MTKYPKWDIVDDVVSHEIDTPKPTVGPRIRDRLFKVVTSAAIGSLVLAGSLVATQSAQPIRVQTFGSSKSVALSKRLAFRRPRGRRAITQGAVDTQVGLSTRRLADLHKKLFSEDMAPQEELTGDYSFL